MVWTNDDGLRVKFGREEAMKNPSGTIQSYDNATRIEFKVKKEDVQSATKSVLNSVTAAGAQGVVLPKGLFIQSVDVIVTEAFTSSGTIGSSTLQIGLIKASDYSTDYDADGITTTSFVGSVLDAAGETTTIKIGATGCGSAIGTTLTEDVVVSVLNSQHASHPFTDGTAKVVVNGYFL
jgi:hypothetical protein